MDKYVYFRHVGFILDWRDTKSANLNRKKMSVFDQWKEKKEETQSYDKSHYTHSKIQTATWQYKNVTK